ncbi:MAG: hypothetical protein JKY62_17010 [Desulfocapsa sp.]|nr:hypothetical protein [Desulfocapsa sp.]
MKLSNIVIVYKQDHLVMVNNIKENFLAELEETTLDEELDSLGQIEWCNMYLTQQVENGDYITAMVISTVKERIIDSIPK